MNFVQYLLADIVGIVAGLCAYDFLVSIHWVRWAKRSWKYLSKQLVGLFRRKKKVRRKSFSKGRGNDIY